MAVAKGEVYDLARWHKRVPAEGSAVLVDGPLFLLDQVHGRPTAEIAARYPEALLVIPREGTFTVAGDPIAPGGCALAKSLDLVEFPEDGVCLLARACAG